MISFRGHCKGAYSLKRPFSDVCGAFPRTAEFLPGTWRSSHWDSRCRRERETRPGTARGFAAALRRACF